MRTRLKTWLNKTDFIEWELVNEDGTQNWENGDHLYISDIKCKHRNNGYLKSVTKFLLTTKAKDVEYVYFKRPKYNERQSKYKASRLIRRLYNGN